MPVILKNNAFSTLATAITASDTGIVVADGSKFPALSAGEYFYATLVSPAGTTEIVKVTARVSNSLTVVRAQDGSSAASFQVGARLDMRVNAASISELRDEASEVSIADAGGYYTSDNVEGALQTVGANLQVVNADLRERGTQERDTLVALLADADLTYTTSQPGTVVAGDIVRTRAEGFSYEVMASTASQFSGANLDGYHLITSGGVKIKHTPSDVVALAALDAQPNIATNQLEKLRAAFVLAERLGLPVVAGDGYYRVQTAGITSAIYLKKVPTILGMLRLEWTLQSATINNRIFEVDGRLNDTLDGIVVLLDTITGSPTLNKHQRTVTAATGLSLSAGDWIAIAAGEDPTDSNEHHWNIVTRVEAYNSGTGSLTFTDGAPYDIAYGGTKTDILIWKLDHDPTGGSLNLSVDYSAMGSNRPSHPVIVRFARSFQIPEWEENETDFGLALATGVYDAQIGNYLTSQTATQQSLGRNPRQSFGPWNAKQVRVGRLHNRINTAPQIALALQIETHCRDLVIDELVLDANLATPPTQSVCVVAGGSSLFINRATIRSNQILPNLHVFSNTDGTEDFTCGDLFMDGQPCVFDPRRVMGRIELGDGFKFGPREQIELEITSVGSNLIIPLRNMIVYGAALWSADLTSLSSAVIRGAGGGTLAQSLGRTANSQWVRTAFTAPNVYWSTGGATSRLNRMDNTDKELFFNVGGTSTKIFAKLDVRRVDGDWF
jgi:hypothetical protein